MEPPTGCVQSESWSRVCCCMDNNMVVSGKRWRHMDVCSRLPPACRHRRAQWASYSGHLAHLQHRGLGGLLF